MSTPSAQTTVTLDTAGGGSVTWTGPDRPTRDGVTSCTGCTIQGEPMTRLDAESHAAACIYRPRR